MSGSGWEHDLVLKLKLLGVKIDYNLTFIPHIVAISMRVWQKMNALPRVTL